MYIDTSYIIHIHVYYTHDIPTFLLYLVKNFPYTRQSLFTDDDKTFTSHILKSIYTHIPLYLCNINIMHNTYYIGISYYRTKNLMYLNKIVCYQ